MSAQRYTVFENEVTSMIKFDTYLVCYNDLKNIFTKDICSGSNLSQYLIHLSKTEVTNLEVYGLVLQELEKKVITIYSLPEKV